MNHIDHDLKVPHAPEDLGRLDGFDRRKVVPKDKQPIYIATGACPQCHAPGQQGSGYLTTVHAKVAPWVEIMMKCECGFNHGEKGEKGCGREWTVGALADDWTLSNE